MTVLRLMIETQHKENYGAHDWNGEGTCPQYWKYKGGSTYVLDFDPSKDTAKELVKAALRPLIEDKNDSFEEYLLDWSVLDRDAVLWDEWDSPTFITKNFYGNFIAERNTYDGATESYVMMPKGDRSEYHVSRKEVA